jgi:hypothetical protein
VFRDPRTSANVRLSFCLLLGTPFICSVEHVRDLLLRAKHLFGAAIFWTTLNPVARLRDERAIAMTNEAGRTGP